MIVKAADDKKANYVTEIDLRGKTVISDFFIICSGTSNIHIRAVADGIVETMEKAGVRQHRSEGYSEATWVVLDYGDVIVHVMSEEERDRYKLESLWTREVRQDATGQSVLVSGGKPRALPQDDESDKDDEEADDDSDAGDES
jgi:ribosome-associated protein